MRYRIFGRTGLRVSSFALGTGNFGKGWGYGSDREEAQQIYTAYREAGGNFIDTADQYQFGQSEAMLGDFIAGERDDVVLATKFSLGDRPDSGLQRTGNSRKAMIQSVEASLGRLKTDRIDLLWVHMPDGVTPVDEIVRGLDDLVRSGKILYAGLSDFPAWRVATAATLAELRGWAPIAAVQLEYSLVERTAERELLPMAAAFDLGTVGWSPLGGGLLTGKYRAGTTEGRLSGLGTLVRTENSPRETAILDALQAVATELEASPTQVAIAWLRERAARSSTSLIPILGPRTREQLDATLGALQLAPSAEQLARLEAASTVAPGTPHEQIAGQLPAVLGGHPDFRMPTIPVA
jgi:aryl-alcohol dehydrogenase-like predicted oxidoreductase